jgi:hypothetical protein
MAQIREVRLVDDIDGGNATETVTFALDGREFEIDLGSGNATSLRDQFAPYIAAGRRVGRAARAGRRNVAQVQAETTPRKASRSENDAIRQWARERGAQVADRGRIPASVIRAYQEENGGSGVAAPQFADASA